MGMVSMHLFLAMALFTAAYKTTTGISTRGCTSNIDILKKELVARQLESYFRNEMDIIEIQVKTNTCIALTNDGNTISNKTFASASPIEKYNMFIYFIVTDTGRALMQYPADTDTMALRALKSPKVMMNVDVMLDNHDCALNGEQFRTIFLQTLSTLAPITNNDDISVCYYEVSEKDWSLTVELLFLPYYTYNNFKTFCLKGGVVTEVQQSLPNKLLRWLCIALHLTLPIGFFFIPHTVYKKTNSYRKCDVPFSVSMLLSYITYWKPACDISCCCCSSKNDDFNKEQSQPQQGSILSKEGEQGNVRGEQSDLQQGSGQYQEMQNVNVNGIQSNPQQGSGQNQERQNGIVNGEESEKQGSGQQRQCPLVRLFISIALVSYLLGIVIHCCLRHTNDLENDLLALSGSSAFYHLHALKFLTPTSSNLPARVSFYVAIVCIVLLIVVLFDFCILKRCFSCFISQSEENTTDEVSYPIYLLLFRKKQETEGEPCYPAKRDCCVCYDQSKLELVTERADLNTIIKLVSEVIFSATFWWKLFKKMCFCAILYAPLILIFCIPYVNNCISSAVEDFNYSVGYKNTKVDSEEENASPSSERSEDGRTNVNCKNGKLCSHDKKSISFCEKFRNCFFISLYHVVKLVCTIVIVNITLIQTTTLIFQLIVLTLFVGIPVYPKLLPIIILLTGFIKYTMQAFLKFQSKTKYVLDQMFKANRYKDLHDIPKEDFNIVLKQCSSVNILVVFMKIVALMFVWYTAYAAIKQGPEGLSAWKDVIPSVILFVAPDWLSKFIYNESAEYQYIDQCVERAMKKLETELKRNTTAWLCYDCKQTSKTIKKTEDKSISSSQLNQRTTDYQLQGFAKDVDLKCV